MTWHDVKTQIEKLQLAISTDPHLKPSREHSLVITKLDEARMWAHEAFYLEVLDEK